MCGAGLWRGGWNVEDQDVIVVVSRARGCVTGVDADEVLPQREDLVQGGAKLPYQRKRPLALPQFLAFMVANVTARVLVQLCGSEEQAALLGSWINRLERDRARGAALQLHLESVPGLGLLFSFGPGLGFALEPCTVFAACLLFSPVCCYAVCSLVRPRQQLLQSRRGVVLLGLCRHGLIVRARCRFWLARRQGVRLGCTLRRQRFRCVDDVLVPAHDRKLRGFNVYAEAGPQPGDGLSFIIGLRLRLFLGLAVPAPLKFGFGLPGFFPDGAAVSGPARSRSGPRSTAWPVRMR